MELGDVRLKNAETKKAIIKFLVTNTLKQPMRVKYEVLSSEKNSIPFESTFDIAAATTTGASKIIKEIDLSGYNMDFSGINHNQINLVTSRTTVWIHPDADSVVHVTPADTLKVIAILDKLEIESAFGYFGQKQEFISDSSTMNTFRNFKSGSFDLEKTNAYFEIKNYIGADMQMKINKITSSNSNTGKQIDLNDDLVGKNLNILRATKTSNNKSSITPRKYTFSLNNSNVKEMLTNQPDNLSYKVDYLINPLGNVSGGNDFIYSDLSIEGNIHMEIPLKVRMDSLVIENYSKIDFNSESHIKSGYLNIYTANLFPFDVEIQFYLVDNQRNIVDSLLKENIISQHGIIDANNFVQQASKSLLRIKLDADMIEKLGKYKEMLVWARINTKNQNLHQLYQHYNIDIKLIAEVSYEY